MRASVGFREGDCSHARTHRDEANENVYDTNEYFVRCCFETDLTLCLIRYDGVGVTTHTYIHTCIVLDTQSRFKTKRCKFLRLHTSAALRGIMCF